MLLDDVRKELNERIAQIKRDETQEGYLPLRHKLRIEELKYAIRLIDRAMIENGELAIGQWYYVVRRYSDRFPKIIKARLAYISQGQAYNMFYFTENETKRIIHLNKEDMFSVKYKKDADNIPFFLEEYQAEEYREKLIEEIKQKKENQRLRKKHATQKRNEQKRNERARKK